eukprot:5935963-Pyramimonas_sp.AAC.1
MDIVSRASFVDAGGLRLRARAGSTKSFRHVCLACALTEVRAALGPLAKLRDHAPRACMGRGNGGGGLG